MMPATMPNSSTRTAGACTTSSWWDNRRRGTEYDERRWKRDMHRATVSDIGNTCEA
jgi:hypothetical protein